MYEATAEEIVRRFSQWEQAAARSPNPKVSQAAPLDPPDLQKATELLPRLQGLRKELESNRLDWHGRPVDNRDQAAIGMLWEEWRDNVLDRWNGYRDVWIHPDEFYDGPTRDSP